MGGGGKAHSAGTKCSTWYSYIKMWNITVCYYSFEIFQFWLKVSAYCAFLDDFLFITAALSGYSRYHSISVNTTQSGHFPFLSARCFCPSVIWRSMNEHVVEQYRIVYSTVQKSYYKMNSVINIYLINRVGPFYSSKHYFYSKKMYCTSKMLVCKGSAS